MIVLDASALVDVILSQPGSPWLAEQLGSSVVYAPSHQPSEVLLALVRLQRAGALTDETAQVAAAEAISLPQELVSPSLAHVRRALALSASVRVVDGLYVALAEELSCPLLTTDRRLARTVTSCEVRVPDEA